VNSGGEVRLATDRLIDRTGAPARSGVEVAHAVAVYQVGRLVAAEPVPATAAPPALRPAALTRSSGVRRAGRPRVRLLDRRRGVERLPGDRAFVFAH
jgi:hypothetical protein